MRQPTGGTGQHGQDITSKMQDGFVKTVQTDGNTEVRAGEALGVLPAGDWGTEEGRPRTGA